MISTSPWAIFMAGLLCTLGSGWSACTFISRATGVYRIDAPDDLRDIHKSETGFGAFLAITFIVLALAATVFFVGAAWRFHIIN